MGKIKEKAIELMNSLPAVTKSVSCSRVTLDFYENNAVMFRLDGKPIDWFFSFAQTKTEKIDTRNARRGDIRERVEGGTCRIDVVYRQNSLTLVQHFVIRENANRFIAWITLSGKSEIETNCLVPLDFAYPAAICDPLFLSLEEKMILVPYDNDMWVHYESTPLRPGRTSYDVSVIYNDRTFNGLLLGALDFDIWKNGIRCSAWDARCFSAVSGVADACTHDLLPHGYVIGKSVDSARFVCGWYEDVRDALEDYGRMTVNPDGIYHWDHGVPFGWNSYSALTLYTEIGHILQAGNFIRDSLPNFRSEDGTLWINFDAVFGITKKQIRDCIRQLHQNGLKAGWYMNPLSHLPIQDLVPLRGNKLKHRKDILLKDENGDNYPPIDGKYPIDITLPEAELDFRLALREFAEMGFDYIKLDFLSHGAVEGKRRNAMIRTGRQALLYFYEIVKEELAPEKIGREVFISSSIDPLFPCGYSHSRRCSCDAFGHIEDVRYVLNALTYSWWTNGRNYQFNDPDHTVLYHSMVDGRAAGSEKEARSRFNASVISGTVMLLSDNFGPEGDPEIIRNAAARALKFADNEALNALARRNLAFRPLDLSQTSSVFYAEDHFAVFNFENSVRDLVIDPGSIRFPERGVLTSLNDGTDVSYDGKIGIRLEPYDSCIFKVIRTD